MAEDRGNSYARIVGVPPDDDDDDNIVSYQSLKQAASISWPHASSPASSSSPSAHSIIPVIRLMFAATHTAARS